MKIDHTQPKNITRIVLITAVVLSVLLSLAGCSGTYYIVDDTYDNHPTEVYYHNDLPYWGFYNSYYYYYGIPHMYPWWYYYTLMPHYTYSVHTHVTIYCNNGYYVSKPRGPKYNNNRGGTYKPNNIVVKPNRNNVRPVRTNTNKTNIRVNTNKTNIKVNTNKTNVKTNTNRSNKNKTNVKINRTNSNKSNNKTFNNRSNKTNIRKNTRKPR